MEQKLLLIFFTVLVVSITPQIFAQNDLDMLIEEENWVLIEQQKIILEVGKHSDIHVKHVIETGRWDSDVNSPRIIEILPGEQKNLSVTDEDGDRMSFTYDKETFEESKYIILNQKLGNYDLIVEYDLGEFFELKNGLWNKQIIFPFDVILMIDDEIDLFFGNSRPVDVSDAKGINCIGCNLLVEFYDDEKSVTKLISFNDKEIPVEILSNGNVSEIEYVSGGNDLLNFNVDNLDQIIIVKIPFELLLNPFDVYFTEKDDTSLDQIDKIRKTEFGQTDSHVNVSFRTSNEGVVSITGATLEEHERILEQIKKRSQGEKESEVIEEERKGVVIPTPGSGETSNNPNENMISEEGELSFAVELSKGKTSEDVQDYTVIAIIIGIITAVIIGIIVKVKKN